jgi:NADP-dependent 3-hydroxy acid dehydrogenase YdfG
MLDVTDRPAVLRYADELVAEFGTVNIVINNAGIAFTGDIVKMTFEQIERVMDVDFWGVVNGTKAFLPHLIASRDGHVVNISSVFGLMAVPSQGAYNSAKFAVRGFTEALREEMLVNGHPVRVTCVHPGGIKTAIARNAGAVEGEDAAALAAVFDRLARTSAESAAKSILRALIGNRPRAVVGLDAKIIDVLVRVTGPGYQRLVAVLAPRARRTAPDPVDHQQAGAHGERRAAQAR